MINRLKSGLRLVLLLGLIVLAACGCVMAARKGERRLEERDGPVGHLLGETRQTLTGHPAPTPD